MIPPVSNGRWYFYCDAATEEVTKHDTRSTDNSDYLSDAYHIVLDWKEEISTRVLLGVIFMPGMALNYQKGAKR